MGKLVGQWAGWFQQGGSDKVWGIGQFEDGTVKTVWGRRGAALQSGEKKLSPDAAAKLFASKLKEKQGEGYQQVPFDDASYGVPSFGVVDGEAEVESAATMPASTYTPPAYVTAHVMPLTMADVERAITSTEYGIQQKINGERTLIVCDGSSLVAYNRRGQRVSTVPEAANHLAALGCQFVIDGERMQGEDAGSFAAFDLLEWRGEDVRPLPYSERIHLLEQAMVDAKLIAAGEFEYKPMGSGLHLVLLTACVGNVSGKLVFESIQQRGGEGIIVRTMNAPYQGGDTRHIRKFKFQDDLDCFVIGVNPGLATGSVKMGLVREADGAIVSVGNVRSGLRDCDITRLGEMLARGERPVLKVTYLPIRTVGIQLVEPRTSISELRTDKPWHECLASQFGAGKAEMIAQATAVLPA